MTIYYIYAFLTEAFVATVSPYLQIMLRNRGYSHSIVGLIIAISQIAGLFFPLINGAMIDKRGHYKRRMGSYALVIIICFALFASPLFLFDAVENTGNFNVLLSITLYALVFSIGVGSYSVLNPAMDGYMAANLEGDSNKYGRIRSCGTAGYVALLVLIALINFPSETDNTQMALCIGAVGLLYLVCIFLLPPFKRPETVGDSEEGVAPAGNVAESKKSVAGLDKGATPESSVSASDLTATQKKKRNRTFSWIKKPFFIFMLIFTIYRMGMSIVEMLLGAYMTEVLNLGQDFTLFVALASFSEIFSLIIAGRLIKKGKVTAWTLLLMSCTAMVLRLLIYAFTKSVPMFAVAQCLHAFTFGTAHIAATNFIANNVDKRNLSKAMGLYWAFSNNFTQFLGPLFGGVIIDRMGYGSLFLLYAIFPAISVIMCFKHRKLLLG